ncbi:hypothetical protein AWB69_02916 [Caballeronia udeis]|uniref:Uncharacterized protein n=1 Tax=Caballeronia udeis TaxID=1232866 RepID=A0A158GLI2_9BURK|nr:hypothetical protein AWB69_02916 [Caballeronia udeis]
MDRLINGIFYTMKAGERMKKRPAIDVIVIFFGHAPDTGDRK